VVFAVPRCCPKTWILATSCPFSECIESCGRGRRESEEQRWKKVGEGSKENEVNETQYEK